METGEANSGEVKRKKNTLDVGLAGAWGPPQPPGICRIGPLTEFDLEGACAGQMRPAQASVNGIAAALGRPPGRALSSATTELRYAVGS
ncbi:MAG: hypothetical protein NTV34_01135 [Proteobacteria bacterium]|nr:hypothetical protein [Pseudomonadota bacterium]